MTVTVRETDLKHMIQRMLIRGVETKTIDYKVHETTFVKGDPPHFFNPGTPDELIVLCQQDEGPCRIIKLPYHLVTIEYTDIKEPCMQVEVEIISYTGLGRIINAGFAALQETSKVHLRVPHDYNGVLGVE